MAVNRRPTSCRRPISRRHPNLIPPPNHKPANGNVQHPTRTVRRSTMNVRRPAEKPFSTGQGAHCFFERMRHAHGSHGGLFFCSARCFR